MKRISYKKTIPLILMGLLCISGCAPEKNIEVKEKIHVDGTSVFDSGSYPTAVETAEHQFKYDLSDKSTYTLKQDDFRVDARFDDYNLLLASVIDGRYDSLMIYEKKSNWMLSSSMDLIRDQSTKGESIEGSLAWEGNKKKMTTKIVTNRHYTMIETRLKSERIPARFGERTRTINGLKVHIQKQGKQLNLAYQNGTSVIWLISDRPEKVLLRLITAFPDSPISELSDDF
ncbi:hypothetical protein RCC94_05065 [Exiguobacterium acetylicum]|uniref:hypothetical protein n=1 Tax=Exiguobacterium acetylicum TaxID=41170 RepID=UPI0027E17A85|nr:hypothetical protein [Exiguobacterium acetylicum]MDQ6466846.1 hypothetical protein [Exiguobacterium acetylicum]